MLQKRWIVKPAGDAEVIERIRKELGVDPVIANLLSQRGITTFEEAKAFFRPDLSHLHDPFLMKDMDKATERLERAVKNNEKILVYGDYDVDGTTAVSLMYMFLRGFHKNIDYYIPDRYAEGYGISYKGIDFARDNGFSLIIALDCGIKSIGHVEYAAGLGIDFIICDHHRPGETLPAAAAVLDPKRDDCSYPYKELSGCGIGFKLAQAYAIRNDIPDEDYCCYLDLAVISIAADIVPITGENRVLAYYGLKLLNSAPREGIKAILELTNVKRELTISDLVFIIGPRINAAGRIESGKLAVQLLTSGDAASALDSGQSINLNNNERKELDTLITQQALEMIDADPGLVSRKSTVLFNPEWHKGVIGIVASRLTERYYRPTVVLTESNGMATGSARSVKDFDVYEAICSCSDLLEQFGGHKYAAGLTMKLENVEAFVQRFEDYVSATLPEHLMVPEIEIDAEIKITDIVPRFFRIIKQFAPFGPGNMAPVFMSRHVVDKGFVRVVGNNHLKLDILQPDVPRACFSSIAFGLGQHFELVQGKPFDVCYNIEENDWNGTISLQLNVKDVRAAEAAVNVVPAAGTEATVALSP
jgi:single-stranded-DNA-specific exonuclease